MSSSNFITISCLVLVDKEHGLGGVEHIRNNSTKLNYFLILIILSKSMAKDTPIQGLLKHEAFLDLTVHVHSPKRIRVFRKDNQLKVTLNLFSRVESGLHIPRHYRRRKVFEHNNHVSPS